MPSKLTDKEREELETAIESFADTISEIYGRKSHKDEQEKMYMYSDSACELSESINTLIAKKVEEAQKEVHKNARLALKEYPSLHLRTWLDATNNKGEIVPFEWNI